MLYSLPFFLIIIFSPLSCFEIPMLSMMTLEEKVGQLLIPHFHGEIANEDSRILIQEIGVSGFIYYEWTNKLSSPEQIHRMSQGLQNFAHTTKNAIPLFIAIDQEGGRVTRLKHGFTQFPANSTIAETGNCEHAKIAALTMGKEMRAVGINMNFAPVVDVNVNPANPIIGTRSFSNDPKVVATFGDKALQGYREAGVIATLKHFPGHGDVNVDSHKDLPIICKSMEELEQIELFPFEKLAKQAEMIMTAHLLVPVLDPEKCSTLSPVTLNYIKNKIGFKGIIISDSLIMQGILKRYGPIEEAAIEAFNAGCDILLLGGRDIKMSEDQTNSELSVEDIRHIHSHLVNAVKNGRISQNRLDEALIKILKLKERYLY